MKWVQSTAWSLLAIFKLDVTSWRDLLTMGISRVSHTE